MSERIRNRSQCKQMRPGKEVRDMMTEALRSFQLQLTESDLPVSWEDHIQGRSLTESALLDSHRFEILSCEEVENLKKQVASLNRLVKALKPNLRTQFVYLDGMESSGSGEHEKLEQQWMCVKLAWDWLTYEKHLLIPNRKLVEHTAAILLLEVQAKSLPPIERVANGDPASPSSLYASDRDDDKSFGGSGPGWLADRVLPTMDAVESPSTSPPPGREQIQVAHIESYPAISQVEYRFGKIEEFLESVSHQLLDLLVKFSVDYSSTPLSAASDFKSQTVFIAGLIEGVCEQLLREKSTNNEIQASLIGLWDSIKVETIRHQHKRKKCSSAEADVLMDKIFDPAEPYSFDSLRTQVLWMQSQVFELMDQESVLKLNIEQQRELNKRSDEGKQRELERSFRLLTSARRTARIFRSRSFEAHAALKAKIDETNTLRGTIRAFQERIKMEESDLTKAKG